MRLKDRYFVKAIKWALYKRFTASPKWRTRFFFDRALRKLGPGDVVVDCGANVGEFTGLFLSTGATVHAFEPDPWTFKELQRRFPKSERLFLYPTAVSDCSGMVELYRRADFSEDPEGASVSSSLCVEKSNVDPDCSISVPQISLVEFLRDLDCRVALLKIDIEGEEVAVLEHMIATDSLELCGQVFVETHEDRIPSLKDRTERLRALSQRNYSGRLFLDWK